MSRDASTYRAARRNLARREGVLRHWPAGRMIAPRQDGFRLGWHETMEPSPMGSGVPKPSVLMVSGQQAEAA